MPTDNADFEAAQQIHELLCAVADQGSKEEALDCSAMTKLLRMSKAYELHPVDNLTEFLFRCAIAVQFGPVEATPSEGARQNDAPSWGDDTLSQEGKETANRIEEMTKRYNEHHDEEGGTILPEDKDDPNQGFS